MQRKLHELTAWLPMKDKDMNKFYICILIKCTDNNKWKIRGTGTRKLLNIKKVW